ncbi:FRG domain-containing protein [Desulfobacula sp.]|uniref:FRG domain-containing protein n=1 Tax=Desulfobacula sp. TaxID=2593537 RepID=UPI0025C6417D|nr:FRG domain-containing protein [Desulfobacula sp.]MBC2702985.1 FRG domain-containing protein [Desulfobacula sp.]
MSLLEKEITSLQDLLQVLQDDNTGYNGSIWYRGQAEAIWSLLPSYFRLSNAPSESTLLKRFKQNATMLVDAVPKGSFDWLFLMQHYGIPTRLLDWSENPLIALYFAIEKANTHSGIPAALWSLKPSELNKNAGIRDPDEEFYIPSFEEEILKLHSIESLASNPRTRLKPVATIAARNNPRIQAQLGVFTIHHLEQISIEEIGDSSHVIKYVIPDDSSKELIANQLSILGFTKFQLFPELASIGDIIRGELL